MLLRPVTHIAPCLRATGKHGKREREREQEKVVIKASDNPCTKNNNAHCTGDGTPRPPQPVSSHHLVAQSCHAVASYPGL